MGAEVDRQLSGVAACLCRHGDVAAEVSRQRPLLERAARGDRQAFGRLVDEQVEGVYRYLLGWAGDRAAAEELTGQVFHAALAWLPVAVGTGAPPAEAAAGVPRADIGDLGARLVAMAREAVSHWRGTGRTAGPAERRPSPADPLEAVALLGDPERDVVVLRLLLGHSLAHTAHLSGYDQRAVLQLQLTACLAVRSMTGGSSEGPRDPGPQDRAGTTPRALELERRLRHWDVDMAAGDDPELADALAVASSLRLAAPAHVVAPAYVFVERLRAQLLAAQPPGEGQGQGTPRDADDGRDLVPRKAAGGGLRGRAGRAVAAARVEVSRRPKPWAATAVAATLIVVVLSLQAFGSPRPRSPCRGASCPQATVRAAPASATAAPLTSIRGKDTTTTTPTTVAPTTVAAPAPTAPPATTPAATAPRTTRPPRTTTTRRPATTAATTTSSTTTTTTEPPTST